MVIDVQVWNVLEKKLPVWQTMVWSLGFVNPPLVAPLVKSTEMGKWSHDGQKDQTQVLVARRSKAPFGRTTVKKTDS